MYNDILNNSIYIKAMEKINSNEVNRIYCRHGLEHSLDVARIAYIIALEKNIDINKDIIYATALLHDIGRSINKIEHNKHSADLAEKILKECNYSNEDINIIKAAIYNHRAKAKSLDTLADIIKYADKISRSCFNCNAYDTCYWEEERKNKNIIY